MRFSFQALAVRPVIAGLIGVLGLASPGIAQQENPVYVDDSPQAWDTFRRAADHVRDNAAESIRLYQELLDDFALKLIPAHEGDPDQFASVRSRVLSTLRLDDALLERYRQAQTPAAQQLLEAGDLERLARTRSLTEPGLEALLRLAQRDVEAARFYSAINRLSQVMDHPDFAGRRAAHAHFMAGLAWHGLADDAQAQGALQELSGLGSDAEPFRALLATLLVPEDRPATVTGVSSLDRSNVSDLSDIVGQAIWSEPLEDSLWRKRQSTARPDEDPFRTVSPLRGAEADLATAVATVTGSMLYVNQGTSIVALNRLTGRRVWPYTDRVRLELPERDGDLPMDVNAIAVSGDALVTLTGHATAGERSNQGRIVCLDASTGELRWPADLRSLSTAGEENLFPHGAPVIADGMVFVAARRVSPQMLTSAYVVALDLADGHVRWSQYITSSGGLKVSPRPFSSIVHANGALFIACPVGAVARLDPGTGEIRWLRRSNVPLSPPFTDQSRRPWEITAPVVTSRGVVAIQPDQRRIALLDLNTGEPIETRSATSLDGWNSPRYLLADDRFVYAIGTDVRAFDIERLDHPAWRLPAPAQLTAPEEPVASEPIEIRGRVQLVQNALVVPTSTGVLIVDHETGQVRHRLTVDAVGNPLAADSQLFIAAADRVDSYMSFTRAEKLLREWIAQAPVDPEPALSLLRIGMRVRSLPLALESARLAMTAIDRMKPAGPGDRKPADARKELFSLLLDLADARVAATPTEGESLFAIISTAAQSPDQRVEYLLAYGDWLADHAVDLAVETYQTILSDRLLATEPREVDGVSREAGAWAAQRLQKLIEQRGATVYAPQSDFARTRLDQVLSQSPVAPDDLLALAREFPFADAAVDAAVAAAKSNMEQRQPRSAMAAMTLVVNGAPNAPASGRAVGALVRTAINAGWNQEAARVLQQISSSRPKLLLMDGGNSLTAQQWLATFTPRIITEPALPKLGDSNGTARVIPGAFVPAINESVIMPVDRAVIRDGDSLQLVKTPNLEPVWTATIETEPPSVLRFDDRSILLWMGTDADDPKALLLDAADGSLKWTTPKLATLLPLEAIREAGRLRGNQGQMPDGEPFDPAQTLPLVNPTSLVLVQRTGGVACFDLSAAPQPGALRWVRKETLEQVHIAHLTEYGLIVAGRIRRPDADARAAGAVDNLMPAIMVLDPVTGEPLHAPEPVIRPLGSMGVRWLAVAPAGRMIYATDDGLEAIDLFSGQSLWTNSAYSAGETQNGWTRHGRLVVQDHRQRLRSVNMLAGSVSEVFDLPARAEWDPMDLKGVVLADDHTAAHYRQRVVMYDDRGTIIGSDMITDEREYRWLVRGADRMLVISSKTEQAPIPDANGRRMQYLYRIYSLSNNGKVLSEPLAPKNPLGDRVMAVTALDGWLLMSQQSTTYAMPMGGP